MDALSPTSKYEKVVFMKGAQIGGTEAGNNWIGYIIDQAPGPMLVVQPTVEMGKRWSKGRLAPLIEDTPCLRNKVEDPRSRDSGNTVQSKEFPGGHCYHRSKLGSWPSILFCSVFVLRIFFKAPPPVV